MAATEMKVIDCDGTGGVDILHLATRAKPVAQPDEVLVKVAAAGVNRADILQRRGKYPPPQGASDILGIEISGIIESVGTKVKQWKVGDKICALLSGGGYAQYAAVPATHCLPVPANVSLAHAAALPEAIATVYANIFEDGALKSGDTALIHGGSSGIGTMAIQMIKAVGGSVITTVGNEEKAEACYALGADFAVNYHEEDFVTAALKATYGRGVNLVLDMIGGDYINRNLQTLAHQGRHISIATQSGTTANVDIRLIMGKNLILTGSTLRGRDKSEKARLIAKIGKKIWPLIEAGKIKPVIFQSFPLKDASEAHKVMETSAHIGKMILEIP